MLIISTSNEVFNIYDKLDIDKKEEKRKDARKQIARKPWIIPFFNT